MYLNGSAPEEHHVYSLHTLYLCAPAERHVLWRVQLHAAPNGAGQLRMCGYKHVAPLEQEPRYR